MTDPEPRQVSAQMVQVEVKDGPAACRNCGHEFRSYRISTVEGRQNLVDLDDNLIFDLDLVCKSCVQVFGWHTNYRTMRDYSQAFHRLMAHYQAGE